MTLPKLKPCDVEVLIDTREQAPFENFNPFPDDPESQMSTKRATLTTGDYSLSGLQDEVVIERKSLDDLGICLGTERERFHRELRRMLAFPHRVVVVETDWISIEMACYRSRVSSASAVASIASWQAMGINFQFCGSRESAELFTAVFLWQCAKRFHRKYAQAFSSFSPSASVSASSCS